MATYYVHKGVGSDSNNGLSWANCFATLKKARDVSGNNDTIYVRAGSTPYYETLELRKNGQKWLADDGHQVGRVTSGTFSPTLAVGGGLALIDRAVPLGGRVGGAIRDRVEEVGVGKPPFVPPAVRRE